jgi:DNA primase
MLDPILRDAIQSRAVELFRTYLPSLKPQGRQWVTHCPFHDDTTPSFVVSPDKGLFHCHGCKVGGDMLTFVQRFKGLRFPEALAEAAQTLGLALPASTPEEPPLARLAATADIAADIFASWLWHDVGKPARLYLQQRGIAEDTARRFRLGFHPDHATLLRTALAQHECDPDTAQQLGLLRQKHGHWMALMRGRLIFPICDRAGTVQGFGARALTERPPKYLNSPASPLFHKGRLLYGLLQAIPTIRQEQRAVIVEGYLDVLTLSQAGLHHTVAPMATAFTPEQLSVIRALAHMFPAWAGASPVATQRVHILQPCAQQRPHHHREACPDVVYVTDPSSHLLEANPALVQWAGVPLEQLRHRHVLEVFAASNREALVVRQREVEG